MAWALQELRLHQQAEREGVQRELLESARSPEANSPGLPDSPSPCRGLHTYARRAHNTHSPARLPLPLGRHPGLLPFGNSAFGTPHHTTPHPEYCSALPMARCRVRSLGRQGPDTVLVAVYKQCRVRARPSAKHHPWGARGP